MMKIGDLLGEQAAPGLQPGPDVPGPDRAAEEHPDLSTERQRGHRRRHPLMAAGVAVVAGAAIAVAATWLGERPAPAPRAAPPSPAATSTPAGAATGVLAEAAPSIAVPPPISASSGAPGRTVPSGQNQSDPFLLRDRDRYYLYTSGVPGRLPINVPVATATDFRGWSPVTDALPVLPHWARSGFTWAPDVHRFGSATVLYFTAGVAGSDQQCVGIATSTSGSALGPFTAEPTPFLCQTAMGGTIDPRVFTDATGVNWMLYKSDQNIGGAPTPTVMWSQRLSPDGLHLIGPPFRLMGPDEPWQGTIVEAPDMVRVGRAYWLVYSGNWYNQPDYAIGAARCAGPSGPCADTTTRPLLGSNTQGAGPGEASVYSDETGSWLFYTPVMETWDSGPRPVMVTRIGFGPDGVYLAAGGPPPTIDPLAAASLWLSS